VLGRIAVDAYLQHQQRRCGMDVTEKISGPKHYLYRAKAAFGCKPSFLRII